MLTGSWPTNQESSLLQEMSSFTKRYWDSVISVKRLYHYISMMMKRRKTRKLLLKTYKILWRETCTQESKISATCAEKISSVTSKEICQEGRKGQERVQRRWFGCYWHRNIFGFWISWRIWWRTTKNSELYRRSAFKILRSRGKQYWVSLRYASRGDGLWKEANPYQVSFEKKD